MEEPELIVLFPYYKDIREDILKGRMDLQIVASTDFYGKDSVKDTIEFNSKTIER